MRATGGQMALLMGSLDRPPAPFISMANAIVERIVLPFYDETDSSDAALLVSIENLLACHFMTAATGTLTSESVGKLSESRSFGKLGLYLDATSWGQQAIALDVSGALQKYTAGLAGKSVTFSIDPLCAEDLYPLGG